MKRLSDMLDKARDLPPPVTHEPEPEVIPTRINGVPRLRWEANTFSTFRIGDDNALAVERCHDVVRGSAWCALLGGGPGTGKTHLAIAAMHEFPAATFFKVPDFLDQLRRLQFEDDKYELYRLMDSLQTDRVPGIYGQTTSGAIPLRPEFQMRRLVVFDELGVEKQTEWAGEQLYRVLDARYDNELPTIITTNQPPARIDERIRSRFASGLVVLTGKDQRR